MLLFKNPQSLSDYQICLRIGQNDQLMTKSLKNWVKIADFLIVAYFWAMWEFWVYIVYLYNN